MEQSTIKLLKYICIGIIILIILRFLYLNINEDGNKNIETFIIDNNNAIDLLSSKLKSTDALHYDNKTGLKSEMAIYPWSNKIYNMQNTTLQQIKQIALYKPNLVIKNIQYYKLGDMVSQDVNYNKPSPSEFTLLIKKTGSDIKPPTDYSLVVDYGDKNIDPNYYTYATYFNDISNLNNISTSLTNCSTALTQLSSLVYANIPQIKNSLKNNIYKNATLIVNNTSKAISQLNNVITLPLVGPSDTINGVSVFNNRSNSSVTLKLPAGIKANIIDRDNNDNPIDISISNTLDTIKATNTTEIAMSLPFVPYGAITSDKITHYTSKINIFENISTPLVLGYIKNLCLDINNIYSTENTGLIQYLNLGTDKDTVNEILGIINSFTTDVNNLNLHDTFDKYAYNVVGTKSNNNTLLGNIIYIILNTTISYSLTFVTFTPSLLGIKNPGNLIITGFDNELSLPPKAFEISINPNITDRIKSLVKIFPNINKLSQFSANLNDNTIADFPLQIYNPLPPDGYLSLGHIFCNFASDLDNIKASQNVACVPSNCVREIRAWISSDKIFEYNKNGKYWAIYLNPYTGTFISTNTPQLPAGKVSKVVSCVAKCTAVDDLKKADECARKYYNINKKAVSSTPVIPNLVSDQEEEFYLSKIKVQSDSIAKLGQRAQQMQLGIDKATIINREMNKNKLQSYVDTQKVNIDMIMQRLIDDRSKIDTNINIPLQKLLDILNNLQLPPEVKNELITYVYNKLGTGDANTNKGNVSCPKYDTTGLVKKKTVSDVCYGCDSP
jgi:hypothetical protein